MSYFRKSIIREIRRFGHDRLLVMVTVIIPVFMALGYVAMFAKGTVHNMPIAVCDADQTPTSRQLVNMFESSPTIFVAEKTQDLALAQQLMSHGKVDAIVHIPQGMERKVMSGGGAEATAFINGTYITKSALLQRDFTTIFQAFNVGVETKLLTAKGLSQVQSYAMSYPVVMQKHILYNPFGSYSYYLLPGLMPLILIVIVTITVVYVVGSELRYGTAEEWIETAGGSFTRALVAKLLPYIGIFSILIIFFNTILYRYMGLPFQADDIIYLVAANILVILAYMSLGLIFLALTSSMRFGLSVGAAVAIASFSFSGLTFPHIAMYPFIVGVSKFIPFNYYLNIFIAQSMRGADITYSLSDIGYLGLFSIALIPFIPLLKKRCTNPKFYGKL